MWHCGQRATKWNPFTRFGFKVWTTVPLYRVALGNFDLCFSGDAGFANNVRQNPAPPEFKLLRVTLPLKPQDQFIDDFLQPFRSSDWNRYRHGDDWP